MEQKHKVAVCGGCVVFITSLVLFFCSFNTIDVNDVCLKYGTITREVEDEPTKQTGYIWTGIDHAFLCFPRTVLKLDYTSDGLGQLQTRTREGLLVGIDVSIEYKLLPGSLKKLFDLVVQDYEKFYNALAQSTLRNAASQYTAAEILKSSQPIQNTMKQMLDTRFNTYFATVIAVQVRQLKLPNDVQAKLQAVLDIGLKKDEALKSRDGQIAEFNKKAALQYKEIEQTRVKRTNIAKRNNDVAMVERDRELVNIQTVAQKTKIEFETKRNVDEQNEEAKYDSTIKARTGELQKEQNRYDSAIIVATDKMAIAVAQAKVTKINGTALYESTLREAKASADTIRLIKGADGEFFSKLNGINGFNAGDIVKHNYVDTLKNRHNTLPLFVDYKKVPMMVQANGNTERIKQLNDGPVPAVRI